MAFNKKINLMCAGYTVLCSIRTFNKQNIDIKHKHGTSKISLSSLFQSTSSLLFCGNIKLVPAFYNYASSLYSHPLSYRLCAPTVMLIYFRLVLFSEKTVFLVPLSNLCHDVSKMTSNVYVYYLFMENYICHPIKWQRKNIISILPYPLICDEVNEYIK